MKKISIKNAGNKVAAFVKKSQILEINNFFTDENPETGVCSKEEMTDYIGKLDSNELFNFDYLLKNIAEKARVNLSTRIYTDRFGIDYVYVNINYLSGGGEKFKVICFDGFEKFRKALKTCVVSVSFSEIIEHLGITLEFEESEKVA